MTSSRGYAYLQTATVGGDLGGFYNMHFESEPFTFQGQSIRVRDAMRLVSPTHYKVATTVSTGGERFINYGNPCGRKGVPDTK